MSSVCRHLISVFCLFSFTVGAETVPIDHAARMKAGTELFVHSIRPALESHCLKCHGGAKVRAGFDVSSRDLLLKGGDSGPVVNLAEPVESKLIALIRHEEDPAMPPKEEKLSDALASDFENWIRLGAPYDKDLIEKDKSARPEMTVTDSDREFWSFRPLGNPETPHVESDWVQSAIDRFIYSKLLAKRLEPNPPADDRSRIRRAYLDLIGLPPSPQELEEALAMSHEKLVDRLLASPHYGERWARHWLDAARFAESHGFEQDYDRPYAYHYRDFVIKALNANMPWDQFVRWQIAGDELAPDDPLALMATGFLGAGAFPTQLTEKEFESARYDELDDMTSTLGTAMLGLTIGCARCHDHKFDPLPVADYYRMASIFTTTIRSEIDVNLDPEGYRKKLASWEASHARTVAARDALERSPEMQSRFDQWLEAGAPDAASHASDWILPEITAAASDQKATTLSPQTDGAILASGKAPARETYTVQAKTQSHPLRFLRIEGLTHDSLPRKGPGRAGNGNFALSNLQLFLLSPEKEGKKTPLKLRSARATHQQNQGNLSVASAIDGDPSGTGWAVDGGGIGKDQAAVFELETPLDAGEADLECHLTFSNNAQHSLGRFRLSVSSLEDPPVAAGQAVSEKMGAALAALKKREKLGPELRAALLPVFYRSVPEWVRLDQAEQASLSRKPSPNLTKVQVSSEGFPPTKHHADGRGFPHFYKETHFLHRGDANQKKGVAEPGYLQVLMRNGKTSDYWRKTPPPDRTRTSHRRSALADWMTDVDNGAGALLARVAVNRIWHHHFGRGIVATPNDFGLQGARPTHPELLDYLARQFIASGWNVKALHREILLSAVWRQSSAPSAEKAAIDPDNQWLWRFTPRRLEAEIVRDAILSAAGQLDKTMFGPGTLDESQRRRGIYFMMKRSRLVPMMQIFDQPEPLTSQGSRPSTTIAPQALFFINNPQVVKWSAALAARIPADSTETAVRNVYHSTLGREPDAAETAESRAFLEAQAASYQGATNAAQLALSDLCQIMFGLNEFIYIP